MAKFFQNRDLGYAKAVTFDDVLLRPQFSDLNSREEADVTTEIVPGVKLLAPLMPANMQSVCSVELAVACSEAGSLATIDQFRSIGEAVQMVKKVVSRKCRVAGAIGVSKDYTERAEQLLKAGVCCFVVDSPHAHHVKTKKALLELKRKFPRTSIIVGNVATKEGAVDLFKWGADCVKVGVGPGSACLTRIHTGSGVPQITALMECYKVAKKYKKTILADGGVKTPGDFSKAIAAGGAAVYAGSIFAGTVEAPGKNVKNARGVFKKFWGSSSEVGRVLRSKADNSYREKSNRFVEGGEGLVPFQGTVKSLLERYVMGLKSAMSYSGSRSIPKFQEKAIFLKISPSSIRENGAHGLVG